MTVGADLLAQAAQGSAPTDEALLWRELVQTRAPAAREQLFAIHFPFARSIANRIWRARNRGDLELAELAQLAAAGLLEAIDHFDPDRGAPFRGYAARRINGAIIDGLTRFSDAREQLALRYRIRSERLKSIAEGRAAPTSAAEALEALVEAAVGLAIGYMLDGTGLFAADEAGPPDRAPNAYETAAWRELIRRLMGEVATLPERERQIVRRHYLDGLTFDQIGAVFGLTKGRVSQIHRQALERLRAGLGRQSHFRLER